MRRIFFLLMTVITLPIAANAITQSEGAKTELNKIAEYLTTCGVDYEIDKDGDIMISLQEFGMESSIFSYVFITVTSSQPYFVKLFTPMGYGAETSKAKVQALANSINSYKCVKLLSFEDSYSIQCEMLIRNASFFNSVFEKLCIQMMFAIEEFETEINKN